MRSRTFSRCRRRPPCTSTLAMTTGPAGKHSTSAACTGRSPTAVNRPPSRSAAGGWSSGPTPGSTTSADSAAAPNAAKPASTPTWRWPPRSSPSVPSAVPPGTSTAGTPDQDHHESADLLADALRAPIYRDGLGDHAGGHGDAVPEDGSRGALPCSAEVTAAQFLPGRNGVGDGQDPGDQGCQVRRYCH